MSKSTAFGIFLLVVMVLSPMWIPRILIKPDPPPEPDQQPIIVSWSYSSYSGEAILSLDESRHDTMFIEGLGAVEIKIRRKDD